MNLFGVPEKYNGNFINDMRMSVSHRNKGIGTEVVNKILQNDKTYMLEPVEDGKTFWKKFGFKEIGKLAIREKVEWELFKIFSCTFLHEISVYNVELRNEGL